MASSGKYLARSVFYMPVLAPSATFFVLQSIAYLVLAFIGILYYSEVIVKDYYDLSSFGGILAFRINNMFLNRQFPTPANGMKIGPNEFAGISSAYFIISLTWLASSIAAAVAMKFSANNRMTRWNYVVLMMWAAVGLAVALLDAIVSFALLADYVRLSMATDQFGQVIATVLMMVLAARGYVVWFINVALNLVAMRLIWSEYKVDRDWGQAKRFIEEIGQDRPSIATTFQYENSYDDASAAMNVLYSSTIQRPSGTAQRTAQRKRQAPTAPTAPARVFTNVSTPVPETELRGRSVSPRSRTLNDDGAQQNNFLYRQRNSN